MGTLGILQLTLLDMDFWDFLCQDQNYREKNTSIKHTVGFTNFHNTCFIAICRDIQRRKKAWCDGSYCCVEALQRLKTAFVSICLVSNMAWSRCDWREEFRVCVFLGTPFSRFSRIPIFGVIDRTHVFLIVPCETECGLCNKKHTHSVYVQIVSKSVNIMYIITTL